MPQVQRQRDQQAAGRPTAFPRLQSTPAGNADASVPRERQTWSASTGVRLAEDALVKAWANLLRGLTGDESPAFVVNDTLVVYNFERGDAVRNGSYSEYRSGTAINTRPDHEPRGDLALQLLASPEKNEIIIYADSTIVGNFLPQIGLQFLHILKEDNIGLANVDWTEDQDIVLSSANVNPQRTEGPSLLHHLIGPHAQTDHCALEYSDLKGPSRRWSYDEFQRCSDSLAAKIRQKLSESRPSSSADLIIPVLIPQSPLLYISIVAILKAGGAFCPLNLDAPPERVRFVVKDTAAPLLVTSNEYYEKVSIQDGPQLLLVGEDTLRSTQVPDESPTPHAPPLPSSLAYVMYTSGSTGTPKGVGVSHAAATQSLLAHNDMIPHFERFLQFAAPTFDVSVFEIFFPLFRGATLVACDRSMLLADLPGALRKMNIDGAELTPSVVNALLKSRANAPTLRVLLTIGEMLTQSIIDEFGGSSSRKSVLYGMYGPTEAAIHCTIAPAMAIGTRPNHIGAPLKTASAFVLRPLSENEESRSEKAELLPLGHVGELAIGGHQNANGYLNRPEQTSSAFVELPGHGRIYRTGDKAKLLPDGSFECLGRISAGQVKLRGQRVELGEVEEVLMRMSSVSVAVASVISGVLVVFCLSTEDVDIQDVLEHSKKWLPGFMVPGDIIVSSELPRLPSGKVDRKKLVQEYETQRNESSTEDLEYENETQREIASVVSDLLGIQAPPRTSLATLGLDSLMAIRLSSALRKANYSLRPLDLLNADSVEKIAEEVSKSQNEQMSHEQEGHLQSYDVTQFKSVGLHGRESDVAEVIPCSPSQVAMLAETARNAHAYCNWIELRVEGQYTLESIRDAFLKLAESNEILRSGFVSGEDVAQDFVQVVWKSLPESQIRETDTVQREWRMEDEVAMLFPLRIQLKEAQEGWNVLVQLHHAIYDGWSWEHCVKDLNAILKGQCAPIRPSYQLVTAAFLHAQDMKDSDEAVEYWKQHLQDAPASIMPNFYGRTDIDLGLEVLHLDLDINSPKLFGHAKRIGLSLQTYFQSAFAYILSRYLGNSDVVFGTASAGRVAPIPHIEDIIGPCVSTFPMRVQFEELRTFGDVLQHVQNLNRRLLEFPFTTLRQIKKACGADPAHSSFDTLVVWQQTLNAPGDASPASTVDSADYLEFNLTLEIEPRGGTLHVKANYQRSLLPQSQIKLLLHQIEQLVNAAIEPDEMTVAEIDRVFLPCVQSITNPKPSSFVGSEDLAGGVERHARLSPNRIALQFASEITPDDICYESLTYSELNQRANQAANILMQHGVRPDDLVCICMEKSLDLYVSILAVVKAGAGYLPLVAETPPERFRHILEEAKVRVCITSSDFVDSLAAPNGVKLLSIDKADLEKRSADNVTTVGTPSNLAYAIFTSGSTGTPKGVLVTRGNLRSNLNVLATKYPVHDESKLLQACSQAFDVSVFEIFFAWHVGMTLCSAVKDVLFRDIENAVRQMQISHLSLTPTVAALINPKNVLSVNFLVTAGEAVTAKVFEDWAGRGLYQGYGPSETTNICNVNSFVESYHSINNLGPVFENTSGFVLSESENFQPVLSGAVGEFCFGGDQVCRGYLNRPEINAEKFIQHPEHGWLYRSGDYGRLLPDGSMMFTGRQDDQIKIRGQRVELGEINSVLLQHLAVEDCFTLLSGEAGVHQQLTSFFVSRSGDASVCEVIEPDQDLRGLIESLFAQCTSVLAAYMIPSALIPLSALPRTDQGKIDKRKLARLLQSISSQYLDSVSISQLADDEEEWLSDESRLADIFAETMQIPRSAFQKNTSFFSLGLDSISAIKLSRVLSQSTSAQIEVSTVLKHSSIKKLSAHIRGRTSPLSQELHAKAIRLDEVFAASWRRETVQRYQAHKLTVEKILPCTPLQNAMLATITENSTAYFNHTLLELQGDIVSLKRSWQAMVERHGILRTCFCSSESLEFPFAQIILGQSDLPWKQVELAESSDIDMSMKEHINQVSSMQDITQPPWAVTVFIKPSRHVLLLSMHHALYDGDAISILFEELEAHYHGKELLPAPSFEPFLECALAENEIATNQHWSEVLKGFSPQLLNLRPKTKPSAVDVVNDPPVHSTSTLHLSDIERQCKKLSTTVLAATQAAWVRLLYYCLGSADVCFGNVVSGRTATVKDVERVVAPCFNTIPVRQYVQNGTSNRALVDSLQITNSDSLPFQFTSLRKIQSKFSQSGTRLFDTLFILQRPSKPRDPVVWSMIGDYGEMDLPIVIELIQNAEEDSLEYILHSRCNLPSEDLQSLISDFDALLYNILTYPASQALKFDFLRSDLKRVIDEYQVSETREAQGTLAKVNAGAAWTFEEEQVKDAIGTLSKVPSSRISKESTIYQLGLDSINAIQLVRKLQERGWDISLPTVLGAPTIEKVALKLGKETFNKREEAGNEQLHAFEQTHKPALLFQLSIDEGAVTKIRPASPQQSGMLAMFLHTQGQLYLNHVVFELDQEIDLEKFRNAWQVVMDSQDLLHTGFSPLEDPQNPFAMVIYNAGVKSLPFTHVRCSEIDLEALITHHRQDASRTISETLHLPPWQLTLFDTGQKLLLQLSAHHALYDADSLDIILTDVSKVYHGHQLPPTFSIDSFLIQNLATHRDPNAELAFWESLKPRFAVCRFPNLTPLKVQSKRSQVVEKSSCTSRRFVERRCQDSGVTVQAGLQAAWARLLSSYVGERTVTFGVVLSGRSTIEEDRASFPCLTTLPVCASVGETNSGLTKAMLELAGELRQYQFTPLQAIQQALDLPNVQLFDTIIAYQKTQRAKDREAQVPHLWKVVEEEASVEYAISLEIEPSRDDKFQFRLTFKEDFLPPEQAALILDQFDALFTDTICSPDSDSRDCSRVHTPLLSGSPAKEPEIFSNVSLLHEFVERQANATPSKVALEFATSIHEGKPLISTWTYEQLEEKSNKVANLICESSITVGNRIAVCFDKCPEASFAMLGVLKAGCGFVAIDSNAPIERKKFIAEDSASKLILTTQNLGEDLARATKMTIIELDRLNSGSVRDSRPILDREVLPTDTCYCLYTSGTTGAPKGCELSHENAVQAMLSFQRQFAGRWNSESRFLQFASFHFDVSVLEQYWSWSVGICVTSAPRDLILEDLAGTIQTLGITHIDLTPSLARTLQPDDAPSLWDGVFITGGESLKQGIIDTWGAKRCIYNGYGPTEATIGVTMYQRVPLNGKSSNIGRQFDNVSTFVFRPGTTELVLRGALGELSVAGKLVGKGYLNQPDLTESAFPFVESVGQRVYRTGDLVRILHDGSFEFAGRADDQVKLRGQRLEIGEINEVIRTAPTEIYDVATVLLKHGSSRNKQLVAFIVISERSQNDRVPHMQVSERSLETVAIVRETCLRKLAGYMVPAHILPLDMLPLSVNNKADAKKLKELYASLTQEDLKSLSNTGKDGGSRTLTHYEKRISDVLKHMLRSEKDFSAASNIFQLGLDSISVIGFSRRLKEAGLQTASTPVIIQNPVISELATILSKENPGLNKERQLRALLTHQKIAAFAQSHGPSVARSLHISTERIEAIAPCTALQEGIITRSLNQDRTKYFETFRFGLLPQIDLQKLKYAWQQVIDKCQVLRTKFVATDDGYAQVALRNQSLSWHEFCWRSPKELENSLAQLHRQWTNKNLHYLAEPLEISLARAHTQAIMVLHIHHALYDGNSLQLILTHVVEEYFGSTVLDYGPAFHDVLAYGPLLDYSGARDFWTNCFNGATLEPLRPLCDFPSENEIFASLDLKSPSQLESTRRLLGATHQAILQAAWLSAIQSHVGPRLIIGMVVSGRSGDIEGVEKVVGPMFNTLPFHIEFERGETWKSLIQKCQIFNNAAYPYQHTPLRDISKWIKTEPSESLFDTLFVFQRDDDQIAKALPKKLWNPLEGKSTADYPLAFEALQKVDGSVHLSLVAGPGVSSQTVSDQLLKDVETAISKLCDEPRSTISGLNLPDQARTIAQKAKPSVSLNGYHDFQWTSEALQIRQVLADLAEEDPESIDAFMSIFELGMDSVDAIKLGSRLKSRGLVLPVSEILRKPTIEKMVHALDARADVNGTPQSHFSLSPVQSQLLGYFQSTSKDLKNVEEVLPVTPLQESMIAEMRSSNYRRYFNHDVLQLSSQVDILQLRNAWTSVWAQTPSLRLTFHEIDDPKIDSTFAQCVRKIESGPWQSIELSKVGSMDTYIQETTEYYAERDGEIPPIQLSHVKGPASDYLVLSMAHALYDGWSIALLHQDINSAYHKRYQPRLSFAPFLEHILSASAEQAAEFWQDILCDVKSSIFPAKPGLTSGKTHFGEIESGLPFETVQSFCRIQGVTVQDLGQMCWSCLLAVYQKNLDVVFGTVLSGRDTPESGEIMFPMMNTLPVRVIVHGTCAEMLRYVHANNNKARQFQHFPLRRAKALVKTQHGDLFDSLFIYQRQPVSETKEDENLYQSVGGESASEHSVCIEMEGVDKKLHMRTKCEDQCLNAQGAQDLLSRLDFVLQAIIKDPNQPAIRLSEDGISVCNLPPFTPLGDHVYVEPPINGVHQEEDGVDDEWSSVELTIRDILAEVSGASSESISKDSSVYSIGIDSIIAIKVSALFRKQGLRLSVNEMMRAATIRNMADAMSDVAASSDQRSRQSLDAIKRTTKDLNITALSSEAGIDPANVEKVMPATPAQTYVLSMWERSRGRLFYPEFEYDMGGMVDLSKLGRVFERLQLENSILRTTFLATGDPSIPLVQVVLRGGESHIDEGVRSHEKIDWRRPPVQLYHTLHDGRSRLHLRIHHALYDGVSLPLLMSRLGKLSQEKTISSSNLYEDYIAFTVDDKTRRHRQAFWQTYLSGMSLVRQNQPSEQPEEAFSLRTELFRPALISSTLSMQDTAQRSSVSFQSLFLAHFAKAYAHCIGETTDDVVIGLYLANRSHPAIDGLDSLAAPTFNLVPIRFRDPSEQSIGALANQIQEDLRFISDPVNVTVSLQEIHKWTGVVVDCFVNFISLPDSRESAKSHRQESTDSTDLNFREVTDSTLKPKSAQVEFASSTPFDSTVSFLESTGHASAYIPSLDIEATIRHDALDFGLFAPSSLFSVGQAKAFTQSFRESLTGCSS